MARQKTADELSKLIDGLRTERKEHEKAIAEIDKTFARFGIETDGAPVRRGRKPGPKPGRTKTTHTKGKKKTKRAGRQKRRTFPRTAEESVTNFVKQHGKPNAAEVNKHWRKEGRGGKADNTLTKLVKEGKLKRVSVKGERGGRYQVA
ncbi:MAG: hypothetical protein WD534_04680 [Phycisphaeraceae bacterium]